MSTIDRRDTWTNLGPVHRHNLDLQKMPDHEIFCDQAKKTFKKNKKIPLQVKVVRVCGVQPNPTSAH